MITATSRFRFLPALVLLLAFLPLLPVQAQKAGPKPSPTPRAKRPANPPGFKKIENLAEQIARQKQITLIPRNKRKAIRFNNSQTRYTEDAEDPGVFFTKFKLPPRYTLHVELAYNAVWEQNVIVLIDGKRYWDVSSAHPKDIVMENFPINDQVHDVKMFARHKRAAPESHLHWEPSESRRAASSGSGIIEKSVYEIEDAVTFKMGTFYADGDNDYNDTVVTIIYYYVPPAKSGVKPQ